jgi:phage terminase small subunit
VTGRRDEERRRRFAEGLARGLSGTEAAREAGYKGTRVTLATRAHKLRKRPDVAAHLAEIRAVRVAETVAAREEREIALTKIMRGEPVEQLVGGRAVLAAAPPAVRVAACVELGKLAGDYVKKVEIATEPALKELLRRVAARGAP